MIKRQDILNALHVQPFQPFRIHMSGGRSHDVRHPELALVTPGTVVLALVKEYRGPNFADGLATISILHITELEPVGLAPQSPPDVAGDLVPTA